ncbi:MAG: DUF262 domain-containing protein [candidate division Zixibacteria bacterium]|nr:DUF262 domain-containing protein [candidate division Zixibacteria bacterium]
MQTQKYSVNQHLTETVLSWVKSGEIAIPEIQRPFVWDSTKIRDLMDSLYQGYPIGYLIVWRNPTVKLKDGTIAEGKKILIDGQQRVIALKAAILGERVINKEYKKIKITIAFNPKEEKFEVFNPAIEKDNSWLPDISKIIGGDVNILELVDDYCTKNRDIDRNSFYQKIESLRQITKKQIGIIELEHDLNIEIVTEIFIRINSQGVKLDQADFAMSKIASNERYGGSNLRKCIDYFCHLSIAPEFHSHIIEVDKDFSATDYFQKISWLKNEKDDLYDPDYNDMLRVAFTSEFNRGKLADLVSLLSGRNFETRTYEEEIAKESFETLEKGILNFINETNFKRFIMIIKSAGFISPDLIRSQNVLNFAYILYLKLRSQNYNPADIEQFVRKWLVLSILTGRYSASPETSFDYDIKNISNKNFSEYLQSIENAELSNSFWDVALLQRFDSSVSSSPYFNVYLAAQVKANDKGFLSKDISVKDLIAHRGDIHHIFPKDYLKKNGLKRGDYNQIANYVYMQSEINIKIGDKAPCEYFKEVERQCNGDKLKYGGINDLGSLRNNLKMNCVLDTIFSMDISNYGEFLKQRRLLMARKIKDYYFSL